jgi:hypothetical protein
VAPRAGPASTIIAAVKRKPRSIDPETLPDVDLLPANLLGHGEVERR